MDSTPDQVNVSDEGPGPVDTSSLDHLGSLSSIGGGSSGAIGGSGSVNLSTFSLSQKGKVCEAKVESALNGALKNTHVQFRGPELEQNLDPSEPGLIHGAYNFNYFAPGLNLTSLAATGCGRFSSNLHIIVPIQNCNPASDPNVFRVTPTGTYFTAHIDSGYPVDLAGIAAHFFRDYIANRLFGYNHGC